MIDTSRCVRYPGVLADQLRQLWRQQSTGWPMLAQGLANLANARRREFRVDGERFLAQCNPARVVSASAKVDAASLAARKCFLCQPQLPPEQKAVVFGQRWWCLCNPAPIFDPHFTIACVEHEPQLLEPSLGAILDLAHELQGAFTVFYNGPKCGASAPDHLHLQVAPLGVMPVEERLVAVTADARWLENSWLQWVRTDEVAVGVSQPGRFPCVVLSSDLRGSLIHELKGVLQALGEVHAAAPEPMLNLLSFYANGRWVVWIAAREKHRPACYGTEPTHLLVSPGLVDMASMLIVPREVDFNRLTAADIESVIREVSLSSDKLEALRTQLA